MFVSFCQPPRSVQSMWATLVYFLCVGLHASGVNAFSVSAERAAEDSLHQGAQRCDGEQVQSQMDFRLILIL